MFRLLVIVAALTAAGSRSTSGLRIIDNGEYCFEVLLNNTVILHHCTSSPMLFLGSGATSFREHLGNFRVKDYISERIPLPDFTIVDNVTITLYNGPALKVTITLVEDAEGEISVHFSQMPQGMDRAWLRLKANAVESVFGAGEQFSYVNLRGRSYPIWTREQGVGRNKKTYITFLADVGGPDSGGDYHTTYFPQPSFISSRLYYCWVTSSAYTVLNFAPSEFHELEMHGPLSTLRFGSAGNMANVSAKFSQKLGLQPALPNWVHNGAILGLQGGTSQMLHRLNEAAEHNVQVSAVWIQDWVGRLVTSFGSRLFWDWVWNKQLYPDLDRTIASLAAKNIRVLAYINPHLNVNGTLYQVAHAAGYLVKDNIGQAYVSDFGEFFCGTVDFTNPAAFEWYKGVIKTNMIGLGFSGWMADFGEYLPASNVTFFSGESSTYVLHNLWPVLWAKLNREAVEETGQLGNVVFWMRAGFSGVQNYTTLMWAGDQNVDFSLDDGLASTIPAALSLAASGIGLTHFDIGGYTSIAFLNRTKEVLLRSAEAAVFTAVMRTHEGNRPAANWQVYSDANTWKQFASLSRIYKDLSPYREAVVHEASAYGLAVQRPLYFHYEADAQSYEEKYEYLLGRDLLVAPVYVSDVTQWTVYLPPDNWTHLWTGSAYTGPLHVTVASPLGRPPVFYRTSSPWAATLFRPYASSANREMGRRRKKKGQQMNNQQL